MPRRFAFVCNALSGDELKAGRSDAARVYGVFVNPEVGDCDAQSLPPLLDCQSRLQYQEQLLSALANWDDADQLLLYFSGHGKLGNGDRYVLEFGDVDKTILPFDSIVADLQAGGVTRAIIIIDACESGAALESGRKGSGNFGVDREEFPKGMAFIASSRGKQSSYELPDGSASLFTHLLIEGLETGLGGLSTQDNLIAVDDIVSYVKGRLSGPDYSRFPQSPVYSIAGAERTIWLARNKMSTQVPSSDSARTLEELRFLYERTAESRRPCVGAEISHLDWDLVGEFCKNAGIGDIDMSQLSGEVERIGLFSPIEKSQLHNAAVLCFAVRPESFIQQARSILVVGERTERDFLRKDITGPLPRQYSQLVNEVEKALARHGVRHGKHSERFHSAIREAISNAIAHRDYSRNGTIRVTVRYPTVEIVSPGCFPAGLSWETLLEGEHVSSPVDAAIAWYLTTALAFEGIGRGFEVFEEYIKSAGADYLSCEELKERGSVRLQLTFKEKSSADVVTRTAIVKLPPVPAASTVMETGGGHGPPIRDIGAVAKLGRYNIKSLIGRGGQGMVYLAVDPMLGRNVAIKVLSSRFQSKRQVERLKREASNIARVDHPGIVRIFDIGETVDKMFIVMEYVEGGNLNAWMAERTKEGVDSLYFQDVAEMISSVASALAYIHSLGMVHRDIKPGNILLDSEQRPRIIDLGIAAAMNVIDETITVTGEMLGTPMYMSPEQAGITNQRPDHRTDIYSLGLVMYVLLTQKEPLKGSRFGELLVEKSQPLPKMKSINPDIPVMLETIYSRATMFEPDDRYSGAEEFGADLRKFLRSLGENRS